MTDHDERTADVIRPDAFHEPFTMCINADGQPVQRALSDMTRDEVRAAIDWCEADRSDERDAFRKRVAAYVDSLDAASGGACEAVNG